MFFVFQLFSVLSLFVLSNSLWLSQNIFLIIVCCVYVKIRIRNTILESLFNEEKSGLLLKKIRLDPDLSTVLILAATPVLLEDDQNYWSCKEINCSGIYVYKKHNAQYKTAAHFYKCCDLNSRHFVQVFDESDNLINLLQKPLPQKFTNDHKITNHGVRMTTMQAIQLIIATAEELNRIKTAQAITDIDLKTTTGVQNKVRYYTRCFNDKTKFMLGGPGKIVVADHTHGLVHRRKYDRGKNG